MTGRRQAFTLIELIGVLAVIAILAALIVPNLLQRLDLAVGQQEATTLQSFGNALRSSILRNRYIPGATDWAANLAIELGMGASDVATNSRGQARVFLIDPAFQIGTNAAGALPYTQNMNGSPNIPASPRLMILSTIGKPLPANAVSGVPSVADFNAIWNTADGTPPTSATGFSSWTANDGSDLKVQRVNLATAFVHVELSSYATTNLGLYSIDWTSNNTTQIKVTTNGISAYYIQNSRLRLWLPTNVLDSEQILIQDVSYVDNEGIWRSSIGGAAPLAGIFDFAALVPAFLASPVNSARGASTPQMVFQDMLDYMNAYDGWAASGFTNAALKGLANTSQKAMITDIGNLYQSAAQVNCP